MGMLCQSLSRYTGVRQRARRSSFLKTNKTLSPASRSCLHSGGGRQAGLPHPTGGREIGLNQTNMKTKRFLIILIIVQSLFLFSYFAFAKDSSNEEIVTLPYLEKSPVPLVEVKPLDIVSEPVKRRITAYNLIEAQTDGDPCISASGVNLCPLVEAGELICAANFVPFGTILRINDLGDCIVLDRMNERYPYDVDVAMSADQYGNAKEFGVKWLGVGIVYRK